MTEIWKDIEGFEGRYQISNLGNVKSLRYGGRDEVRNLVPKVNNHGYEWVELFKNREKSYFQIHRLVAKAFIPNPTGLPIVNHKDENIRNNCVDNLEWCTHEYNVRYSLERHRWDRKYGKKPDGWKGKYGKYGPYKHNKAVAQVDKNGNIVKIWNCTREIQREENKSQWSIIQCCNGKRKTAYGYTWHFIDAV